MALWSSIGKFFGPTGSDGPVGDVGYTGPTGTDGSIAGMGATGETGFQGPTGVAGPTRDFSNEKGVWVGGGTGYNDGDYVIDSDDNNNKYVKIGDSVFDDSDHPSINATYKLLAFAGDTNTQTGAKGGDGDQGPQGIPGETGDQGPKGDTGFSGQSGGQGPQGQVGYLGITGTKGDDGPQGNTGSQGERGLQGNTGAQGAKGVTGSQGSAGLAGYGGLEGPAGPAGETGPPGLDSLFVSSVPEWDYERTDYQANEMVRSNYNLYVLTGGVTGGNSGIPPSDNGSWSIHFDNGTAIEGYPIDPDNQTLNYKTGDLFFNTESGELFIKNSLAE